MQKAIRLKKRAADEVVVVSVGARQAAETLRTALAKLLKAAMDAEQPRPSRATMPFCQMIDRHHADLISEHAHATITRCPNAGDGRSRRELPPARLMAKPETEKCCASAAGGL